MYAVPDRRCPRPRQLDSGWRVSTIVILPVVAARAQFIVLRLGAREKKGKIRYLMPGPGEE